MCKRSVDRANRWTEFSGSRLHERPGFTSCRRFFDVHYVDPQFVPGLDGVHRLSRQELALCVVRFHHVEKYIPEFVWFDNFIKILTNSLAPENYNFWRLLLFNVVWTVVNVLFHVILGY